MIKTGQNDRNGRQGQIRLKWSKPAKIAEKIHGFKKMTDKLWSK